MERIGITASRIAKGNLVVYNLAVIAISTACSIMLFFICGFSIGAVLFLVSLVFRNFLPPEFQAAWPAVVRICLAALGAVVGILYVLAVVKNIKISRRKL